MELMSVSFWSLSFFPPGSHRRWWKGLGCLHDCWVSASENFSGYYNVKNKAKGGSSWLALCGWYRKSHYIKSSNRFYFPTLPERTVPGLDPKVIEVYRGVGQLLQRYTSGKVPKAFKIIPALANWEEVLYLTSPEAWSPLAMYSATRLFASNLSAKLAQRFFQLVLLPRVRQDIRQHKRLHFALFQSLKKALYKPSAFYRGFLLPLCQVPFQAPWIRLISSVRLLLFPSPPPQSGTCSLREAFIVGSALQKVSVPVLHSRCLPTLPLLLHLKFC